MGRALEAAMAVENGEVKPLVNESVEQLPDTPKSRVLDVAFQMEESASGVSPQERNRQVAEAEYRSRLPKTWFGELSHGLSRGVDKLQQSGAGVGALLSDAVGMDKARDWFVKSMIDQEKDLSEAPSNNPTIQSVDNFGEMMNYLTGTVGEAGVDVLTAIATGGAGAKAAQVTAGGVFERQAAKEIAKSGIDQAIKSEIIDYAKGNIAKNQLGEMAQRVLRDQVQNLAGRYGSTRALALSSIGQEVGSIYSDLKQNPDLNESDRKFAALTGGLLAGMADFATEGWIASKFFPKGSPSKVEMDQAKGYIQRYVREFGKEYLKVMPTEAGTEVVQTWIEEAAKNWADPKRRDNIFAMDEKQKSAFIDAGFKGAVGGTFGAGVSTFATLGLHPNSEVRQAEKDILQKANDLYPEAMDIEVTDSDKELSRINNRRIELNQQREAALNLTTPDSDAVSRIDEELSKIASEESAILGEEESLVNESPNKENELLSQVEDLRETFAKDPLSRKAGIQTIPVDTEVVNKKKTEWGLKGIKPEVINSLDDNTVNFLINENIEIREATPEELKSRFDGDDTFAAMDQKDGGIALIVPSKKGMAQFKPEDIQGIMAEEVIHVADLVQIRKEAKDLGVDYDIHERYVMEERGASLRASMPYLAKQVSDVYFGKTGGSFKEMSDRQIGQEFARMAVELSRTGKIREFTQAIRNSQDVADAKGQGYLKNLLSNWLKAIKGIYDTLLKSFNPKTAPESTVRAINEINKVLDEYGVLVNESQKTKPEPKIESKEKVDQKSEPKEKKPEVVETISPIVSDEPDLTIGEALITNAKVDFDGTRGRLVEDDDGALIVRTPATDYLVAPSTNRDEALSSVGLRALRPSKVKEKLREAYQEIADASISEVQAELQNFQPAGEPNYYRDASEHPLLNSLWPLIEVGQSRQPWAQELLFQQPEFISLVNETTDAILNRSENLIVNTIQQLEKDRKIPADKKEAMTAPFYDLWNGVEVLRQQKERIELERQESEKTNREVQSLLPTASDDGISETEGKAEPSKKSAIKKRLKREALVNEKPVAKANISSDAEKREIASREGFKYDGNMMERLDLYTDYKDQGINPAYGATIAVKLPYTEQDLLAKFNETRAKFSVPLDNDKSPAKANIRSTGSNRIRKLLKNALVEANKTSNQIFFTLDRKESEQKAVQGKVQWDGATPLDLEYATRPHTESSYQAQLIINDNVDALNVAQKLETDMLGKDLGLSEFGPDSPLKAIYELTIQQLINAARQLYNKGAGGSQAYKELVRLQVVLEENMRRLGNAAGSYGAYTGQSVSIMSGESARREAMETLMPHAEKIIGKEAKSKFKILADDLNGLWKKYGSNVANSPKVIATLRKLYSLVNERKWIKGAKQTIVKDLKKLEGLVNKAAARASDYLAGKTDSDKMINRVAGSIIREMSSTKKEGNGPDELDVLHSALRSMGMQIAEDQKNQGKYFSLSIEEKENIAKTKLRDQFAVLMRNRALYDDFITKLRIEYVKAYGGENPSEVFQSQVDSIFMPLMGMPWRESMVRSLVNETLREFEVKLAKLVRQVFDDKSENKYDETASIAEQVRDSLVQFMKDQGVDDDALIDALAKDIESEMIDSIETAREEFFSARGTIREFLKSMGTTLSEAAKEHAIHVEGMEQKFLDFLIKKGYPNTKELPVASTIAKAMQGTFNEMVQGERIKIVKTWQKSAIDAKAKDIPLVNEKMDRAIEKVLQMSNVGAIRHEDIYRALQERFKLPEYSQATANRIQELGDLIGAATAPRTKEVLKQQLADFLTQRRGIKTSDIYTSWMYFSMLSGPSTWMVNIAGNLTSMMGYLAVEAVRHPRRLPTMLRTMFRTMAGVGMLEAKEAFWTGMSLGKQGEKYFSRTNPIEQTDVYLTDSMFQEGKLADLDKSVAKFVHNASRGLKGQFVGRFLAATDIFFYKVAEEMAYAARVGQVAVTPEMWNSAMAQARGDLLLQGRDPDTNPEDRRTQEIIAHSLLNDINYEGSRFRDASGALVNERVTAWTEARSEALDATFTQEPKGVLGYVAKHIERLTQDVPILKLLIPFTRVAANVTNQMVEWTPYGFARYAFGHVYGDDFRVLKDDMQKRDAGIAIRAIMGTMAIMVLIASAEDEEGREPFFTIYGDGPKDIEMRRQMQQKGWKPNTIKVGNGYYSYLYTPLAMALSVVGKQFDKARESAETPSFASAVSPSSAVALLDAVKNQSFLAGITDLFSALDSPDPETKVARILGRMATIPVPNFFKQIDKAVDPSVQEAKGFYETIIRELPIARHSLKPALNIFGQPVERAGGVIRFPGLERFMTVERMDDPVLNMLSESQLKVPGISKSTHLGDAQMTEEQYYEYVSLVGPRVYNRYRLESGTLKTLSREAAQERLEAISREEKEAVREQLKKKYNISR